MDDETILDDWNPSEETLRKWAFDENILLASQDEDLVLHRREYFPVLIPLADDPSCPKADYILSCLDYYLMFLVLRGSEARLAEVREAAELASRSKQDKLQEWARLQERRLLYRQGRGPVSREQALTMTHELLIGICRRAEISLVSEEGDSWEVQLSVPPLHLHVERLSIDKRSGRFSFSR